MIPKTALNVASSSYYKAEMKFRFSYIKSEFFTIESQVDLVMQKKVSTKFITRLVENSQVRPK